MVFRWVTHPLTLLATTVLLVNDHVLKAAWPGLVTGKLSDVVGLVVAPALLGLALVALLVAARLLSARWRALVASWRDQATVTVRARESALGWRRVAGIPRVWQTRLAWAAVIVTGVGFSIVKLTESGAVVASGAWSLVAGPSRILADPTDLVALPALAVAMWTWRRVVATGAPGAGGNATWLGRGASGTGDAGRRVLAVLRRVRVVVGLPLVLVAVTATSPDRSDDKDPTVGVRERAPQWTASLPRDVSTDVAATVVGDSVVVATQDGGAAVFDRRTGASRWWHRSWTGRDGWRKVRVTRDAVVTVVDRSVEIRDLRTGEVRGQVRSVTRAAVTDTTVYVTTCEPRCAIRALDPSSGKVIWEHTKRGAGTAYWTGLSATPGELGRDQFVQEVEQHLPLRAAPGSVVIAEQYQKDSTFRTLALDARTGKVLSEGAKLEAGVQFAAGTGSTYLRWSNHRYDATVTGHDARTDEPIWSVEFSLLTDYDTNDDHAWVPSVKAGQVLVEGPEYRSSQVIDIDSGKTRWSEPDAPEAVALTDDSAVLVDRDRKLAGYDMSTGERRWAYPLPRNRLDGPKDFDAVFAAGDTLAYQTTYDPSEGEDREVTWVRSLESSVGWVCEGSNWLLGAGDDWVVTSHRAHHGHEIRLFRL